MHNAFFDDSKLSCSILEQVDIFIRKIKIIKKGKKWITVIYVGKTLII